jgi:CRISPR/Cas system CSM-associated protein Csm3 (group 7 of RAMP superfamily)
VQKSILSECRLELALAVSKNSQVLVAAPEPDHRPNPDQPGKERQVTVMVKEGGRSYLPGASLKGIFRSRAEYIANSLNPGCTCHLFDRLPGPREPFPERPACSERFKLLLEAGPGAEDEEETLRQIPPPERHRLACPACQLFGFSLTAGRLQVTDFPLAPDVSEKPVTRQLLAIDRVTSGAAEGKTYTQESQRGAVYRGALVLTNFSLWQLGWLGLVLRDLNDGLLKIGHKTTSGLGTLKVQGSAVVLRVLRGAKVPAGELWGLAHLDAGSVDAYGLEDEPPAPVPGLVWETSGLWRQAVLDGRKQQQPMWQALHPLAARRLQSAAWATGMDTEALRLRWQNRRSEEVSQ